MLRAAARRGRFAGTLIPPTPHGRPIAAPSPLAPAPAPDAAADASLAPLPLTRYQRLQRAWGAILWSGVLVSVGIHWIAFATWPTITAPDLRVPAGELEAVELPPEVEIPPPPEAIARPAVPVASATLVAEDITIAPTTFAANPVASLPPPPEEAAAVEKEIAAEPVFTPYTVQPRLLNREDAAAAILEAYPPGFRDAGIGGTVILWFFIDETGTVQNARVSRTSGHARLDAAGLSVAPLLRFSPALNRDRVVPVWVQLPIQFEVRR